MSQTIPASDYAEFLKDEYLSSFISDGGSAVKFAVVPSQIASQTLTSEVMAAAEGAGYVAVRIDAAKTRVSLVQQIFFAVARQVDWSAAARQVVLNSVTRRLGVTVDGPPTLDAIGLLVDLDAPMIRSEMLQGLQADVYRNYALTKDFRLAMLAYCKAELEADAGAEHTRQVLGEWLRGDLRLLSAIREMAIYQKIGRHNARLMIAGAAEWMRQAGKPGLLIVLDIDRLAVGNRREVVDEGWHYTLSNVMDTYEVLRQFIDATDEMSGAMVLVAAPDSLLDDERRGFQAYAALRNRIWDDVRDRTRVNPFAPMVRISEEARE